MFMSQWFCPPKRPYTVRRTTNPSGNTVQPYCAVKILPAVTILHPSTVANLPINVVTGNVVHHVAMGNAVHRVNYAVMETVVHQAHVAMDNAANPVNDAVTVSAYLPMTAALAQTALVVMNVAAVNVSRRVLPAAAAGRAPPATVATTGAAPTRNNAAVSWSRAVC